MTDYRPYEKEMEAVRNFLCGYQLCMDMLNLRKYERKRAKEFDEEFDGSDLLAGNESLWQNRMFEIHSLIDNMKDSREKVILYYHYIRGESVAKAASYVGVSRRTGYRMHQKGLFQAALLYKRSFGKL